jgi:hypothetical protein
LPILPGASRRKSSPCYFETTYIVSGLTSLAASSIFRRKAARSIFTGKAILDRQLSEVQIHSPPICLGVVQGGCNEDF